MVTIVIEKKHLIGFAAIVALALVFSTFADVNTYAPWHFLQQVAKGPHGAPDANRSIDENNDGIVDAAQNLSCGGGTCYVDGSLHVNNTLYVNGTLVFSDGTTQDSANTGAGSDSGGAIIKDYQVHPGEEVVAGEMVRLMDGMIAPDKSSEHSISISGKVIGTNISEERFVYAHIGSGVELRTGKVTGAAISFGSTFNVPGSSMHDPGISFSITSVSGNKFALLYDTSSDYRYGLKVIICEANDLTINCGTPIDANGIDIYSAAIAAPRDNQLLILGNKAYLSGLTNYYELRTGTISGLDAALGNWVEDSGLLGYLTVEYLIPIGSDTFVFAGPYTDADTGSAYILYGIGKINPSLEVTNTYSVGNYWGPMSFSVLSPTLGFLNYKYLIPHVAKLYNGYVPFKIDAAAGTLTQGTGNSDFITSMLEGYQYRLVDKYTGAAWVLDESFRLKLLSNQTRSPGCISSANQVLIPISAPDKYVRICHQTYNGAAQVLQTGPFVGFPIEPGTGGTEVSLVVEGLSGSHANLKPFEDYYYDTYFMNLTTTPSQYAPKIGRSISDSEIWITYPPLLWN